MSKRSIGISIAALVFSACGISSHAAGNGPFPPSGDDYSPLLPAQVKYFEEHAVRNTEATRGDVFPPSGDDYSPLLPAQVKYFDGQAAKSTTAEKAAPGGESRNATVQTLNPASDSQRAMGNTLRSDY